MLLPAFGTFDVFTLAFELTEKVLAGRVVTIMTDRAHAAGNAVCAQVTLEIPAGELGRFNRSSQH